MSPIIRTGFVIISCFILVGCATGGKDRFKKEGAVLLLDSQVIALFKGNTQRGQGWAVYNRLDGTRVIQINKSGKILYRKWWIGDTGQWCLITSKSERSCGPKVYKLGYEYKEFVGDRTYTYEILSGNFLGMPEN